MGIKNEKEIECIEVVPVEVRASDLASRLDRVAEALYPFVTSSESLEKSTGSSGTHSSSIHLHEQPTAGCIASGENDVFGGKDEPKTAA